MGEGLLIRLVVDVCLEEDVFLELSVPSILVLPELRYLLELNVDLLVGSETPIFLVGLCV